MRRSSWAAAASPSPIKVVMRDAVLHGTNKVSLFGIKDVNPAYISSLIVCGALLVFAAVIRIFVIPKFKMVPGKFQMLLEQLVTFFDNLAKTSSPHKNSFLGAYVFAAGVLHLRGDPVRAVRHSGGDHRRRCDFPSGSAV